MLSGIFAWKSTLHLFFHGNIFAADADARRQRTTRIWVLRESSKFADFLFQHASIVCVERNVQAHTWFNLAFSATLSTSSPA
jgi:hypothetical protein